MNKVFKVIWCNATQAMVAVSEFAKSQGKSSSCQSSKPASLGVKLSKLTVSLMLIFSGSAIAIDGAVEHGNNAIAGKNGVAVGKNAKSNITENGNTAQRNDAYINAVEDAVQKGIEASQQPNATVESIKSAVVARLNQSGINNIYFSNYIPSVITGDSIENALNALRDKATEALYVGTIAIGKDAAANKATDTIALGRKAKAGMKVQHVNAISIGANSRSTERNAIALGARAAAKGDSAITIGKDSMSSGTGAISVGANGFSEGTGTMSVGKNTMAYKDGSMALGAFAHAGNKDDTGSKYAIAIGQNSLASKGQSIAIGGGRDSNQGAVATGSQSIAIGGNTIAEGDSSIAIGGDDTNTAVAQDIDYTVTVASEGGVDVVKTQHKTIGDIYTELTGDDLQRMSHPDAGFTPNTNNKFGRYRNTVAGHAAVAIGDKAYAKGALGVAYGTGATVEDDAVAGTALGAGAKSTKINGVALGAGSQTDLDAKLYKKAEVQVLDIYGNAIPGKTAIFNGFSGGADNLQTGDQVSVGAKGFERQIKNVAAGWVNRESTDAINGSQLASVAGALKGEIDKAGKNTPFEYVDENNKPVDKLDDGNYYEENTVVLNPVNNKAYEAGTVLGSNGKGYKPDTVLYKDNPYPAGSIISGGKVYPKGTRFKSDGTAIDAAGNVAQEIASDPSLEITEADRIAAVTPKQRVANNVVIHAKSDASKAPKRVTNVAAGVEDTDAVNVSQIQNYFHTNTSSSAVSGNTTNLDLVNGIGGAKGGYSVAAGVNAQATGNYGSMALGYNSAASTSGAIALGMNSISAGESSVSIGYNATSSGQGSVSLGRKTKTTGSSVALGNLAEATGSSVAIGDESMASEASFAMGNKAKTTGAANVAIGNHALTEGTQSMAIGQGAQAKVEESLALGSFTHALGKQSVAIGNDAFATGEMSTVIGTRYIGNRTMANGHLGHGTSTSTDGKFAIAIGSGTGTGTSGDTVKKDQIAESDADYGIALGTSSRTEVGAEASVAIGRLSQTRVAGGVALGSESIANRKSIDSTKVTASETIDITTTDLIQETDNVYALDVADGDDKTKIKNTVKGELGAVSVGTVTRKFKTRKPGFRYTGDSEETGVKTGNDIAAAEFEIEVATRQIINVAAGSADTDAVNVAQLKAVANVAKKKSVETVSAGDGVGITTSSNVGGVDYKVAVNVDDKTIEIVTIDENGNKVIKQADGTYQNESGNTVTPTAVTSVVVAKTADITTTDGLAIPVDENALATAKDIAEAINASSFNVQANDHAKEEISAGETVKFVDGDNIKVTQDGANFTIATKKDLVVDSIAQSDTGAKLTLGEDAITLSKGNDPVKLTGVKAGESGTDAVNFTQLKAVKDIAEDKSVETVEASAAAQTSGLTVTETTNTATDKNWKVDLNKDTLATQLVVDGSASKATLEEGLDLTYKANGTTKTTSLKTGLEFANGEGTVASIDADGKVKYGLSDAVQADIAAGKKHTDLTVNGGTSVTDTYNTTGNILAKKTTVDGQTIFDVKLADKVVLGTAGDQVVVDGTAGKVKAGQVTVDGKAGDVTGLTNVDLSGADFGTAGRAATEEQLKLVDTEAKKKSVETVSAGAGIAIAETDGANGKDYAVSVDFGEVAAGNAKAVTGGAVHTAVEAAKESVEADGADAGLTVTKEAVAGKGTKFKVKLDDATKAQLKKEETVSTTDTNLTVDGSATNASGAKDFKLGLAKDLVIDSIGKSATGAKLTLGEDAITLSKGTKPVKLTGVADGELSASSKDAVNGSQLKAVKDIAEEKSVETVEASAAAQTSGLTVTETTNTATDKNWKVDLNKDTLATQLVVDGSASKSTLEEGLDLTYKANGTTKTTSLKTGLEFANGEGTVASIDADGKVKYGLSDAVQADIAAGKKHTDLTVNGGTSVTDTYNTTGNILAKKKTVDGQTIFDVKLADKVVLGTAGDQVVVDGTAGKVKAGQVTVDGKAGDVTGLTNVDLSGADFGTAGRAATEEQLKLVDTEAKKKSVETVSAGAGIAIAETDGANGKDYAVSVDFGEVAAGNAKAVTGGAVHTAVEAAKESVEADGADAGLTVTKEAVAGKGTKFKVKLDDATKAQLKKEETVSTTDTNLTVDGSATNASGAKDFKLGLAKDLVIDSIGKSATGAKLTLGEDAITLSKGNDPVKLTGVKAGESGTDAVNFTQLEAVKDIAEDKSVETVEASAAAQTSGLTVTETTNTATDKNWKVDLNKDTLATQLVVDGSASKSTLEEGLDLTYKANGTTKTTSLKTGLEFANGEGTVASIDADGKVKYGLSDAVQADIAAGKKHTDLTVNGGTSVTDTYNTTGNILAKKKTVDGQTIFDVKLADKVVLGTAGDQVVVDGTAGKVKAGQVTVDGKAGDVTGLTNVDLSGADFGTAGRAATEEQLKLVDTEAKKKSVETVSAGAGIAIAETDGANGKDYAVSVDFGEVAAGNAKAVTGDKVHTAVEAAKESVEADGADAGLTVTKEAVAGKGTKFKVKLDDATKAQLKKEETVSTTDTNLTVDGSATNASGAKDFKLGLAKDLVIDSIGKSATGAKLTLGEDAITLSKGTKPVKLTGIKAGESGTDAVNVDQLEAVRTVASQKTKLVAGVGTTLDGLGTDADPYKVNVDFGTVTAGNTKAVTGGAVYNALADKADKNLSNIDNAGKQVITGLVDAEGKDGISVNTAVDPNTGVKKFTIGLDAATNFAISKVETVSSTNANLLVDDKTQNASGGKEFKVTLNKDLTDLDSVVLGDKVADDVVSLSKDKGINAGKKQITNVASGLGGKNLKDIKNTDAEWNNAATVGDLTKVEGNVTHINKIIGGQNADGKPVDGNGDQLTDSDGNAITTAEALKTYDVRGQTATNDNTVISAIKNMNEGGIKYFHTNDKSGQTVGGDVSDTDDSSASGKYATAIGYNASAAAENTIAFGKGAKATAENSIAIGTGNIVNAKKSGAIGDPSIIEAKDSKGMAVEGVYSIGNDNAINSSDTFVLGNNVNSKKVAGKTVAQGDTVENSVYLGSKTTATKSETNAAGKKVRDVGNKNLKSDGTKGKTTSAGDKGTVKSATVGGITYGGFAGATAKGVVSVGAADSERRIQNVAAGEISRTSTDAINGSQLHATNRALANLSDKLMDIDTGSKAGIAGSAAIAMLGQARNAGDRAISAGFATHRGESALAVGVSSWSDNGKWLLKGSASYDSQRNTTFGGSATYNW
ncbi:ESPR-type extended signal peptide-containing protein [Phocoenobacter skyensis]|uniref:ESPR-type extended signal peptide-containing protein n=1 Tax=Phocoenobacter skyensis TaxID=97481 RepID=UPI00159D2BA1|nr:ESPR-type extended signal peptide-containing protein [Pasteurella skyensis]MDP8184901.1 ESPR-type extended signal peptide-containing protein [Pasteurella skyensis]QLB21734.1 hypothetical protein A6B44_00270 [Pasteurella skyensis]